VNTNRKTRTLPLSAKQYSEAEKRQSPRFENKKECEKKKGRAGKVRNMTRGKKKETIMPTKQIIPAPFGSLERA